MKSSVVEFFDTTCEKVIAVFSALGAGLMVLLTLVVFGEIISRYFLGLPITFSSELTSVIFPWMVFLMVVEVTKRNDHIAITLFRDLAPPFLRRILDILVQCIMLFFSLFLVYSSYELCVASRDITLPVLSFMTKVYQYVAITVSFGLVSLVLLLRLIRDIWGIASPPHSVPRTEGERFQ